MKDMRLKVSVLFATLMCLQPAVAFSQAPSSISPTPRIIGGVSASISDAPWQAALISKSARNDSEGQFCGGSIINSTWILTAAHCLDDGRPFSDLMVLVGSAELSSRKLNGIQAKRYIVHEDWDPDTYANDIALIELQKPISFKSGVSEPIALASDRPVPGANSLISGWGATTTTEPIVYPSTLRRAEVQIVSDVDCDAVYGGISSDLMVCATGPAFSTDTCWGDSGGPLAAFDGGRWEVQGITSFGEGCAQDPYPGVYTEVFQYVEWITQELLTKPLIKSISPSAAAIGASVVISGSGFTGTNSVRLGTIEADFNVNSDLSISFVVPVSATTSRVTVANASFETTYSKNFTVAPPPGSPEISRVSSSKSSVGKTISITGKNLETTTSVTINGIPQDFTVRSSRELRVTIAVGTSTGFLVVSNPIGNAQSNSTLRIT